MTYEEFKREVLNNGFDEDKAYGWQCVDLYLHYCKRLGYEPAHCLKTKYAQDLWTERKTNGILNSFIEVTEMLPGDVAVFKKSAATPLSHVAIFDSDAGGGYGWFLGQNQGSAFTHPIGGSATNLIKLPYSATYDTAFRPKCFMQADEKNPAFPLAGADLSEHNSKDFDASGLDFVILRIAYGTIEDKNFAHYAKRFKDKIKGVYVFDYALNDDQARSEAEFAVNTIQKYGLDIPVIFYDFEYDSRTYAAGQGVNLTKQDIQRHTRIFTDRVKELGYQPGVYLNLDYWNTVYGGYSFLDTKVWFASYNPSLPIDEEAADIWQFASTPYDQNRAKPDAFEFIKAADPALEEGPLGSIYRLYNPNDGDHLYTEFIAEAYACVREGWRYEGVAWIADDEGDPVYRLYVDGRHIFTANEAEMKAMVLQGAADEGIAFRSSGPVEIWRMYNPNTGDHVLTASRDEHDALSKAGWYCEGQKLSAMETP